MVFVCHRSHPLARKKIITAKDIAGDEKFIAFDKALAIRKAIDKALRQRGVKANVAMEFDNIETIKRAVELQEGVSILPEPAIQNEVRAGTLVAVPLTSPTLIRPLGIIHRRSGELSRTARRFIDLIQNRERAEAEPEGELVGAAAHASHVPDRDYSEALHGK